MKNISTNIFNRIITAILLLLCVSGSLFAQDAASAESELALLDQGAVLYMKLAVALLILIGIMVSFILIILMVKDPSKLSFKALMDHITAKDVADKEMDHDYDGIRELDNPPPAWLMAGFYISIGFGVVYLLWFHVFEIGNLSAAEYREEIAEAEEKYKDVELTDEQIVRIEDPAKLAKAEKVFNNQCATCHTEDGGGQAGPNLTDDFWIHGNDVKDLYKVITEGGRPGKAMQSWKDKIPSKTRLALANYVLNLKYVAPEEGGMKPEGYKYVDGEPVGKPVGIEDEDLLMDVVKDDTTDKTVITPEMKDTNEAAPE